MEAQTRSTASADTVTTRRYRRVCIRTRHRSPVRPCNGCDCCPRNPFGDPSPYLGELDGNLTRAVCSSTVIRLDERSPCINVEALSISGISQTGRGGKGAATILVILLLLFIFVAVFLLVVPIAVYAQLVYSGRWGVLICCERATCMLSGNFEAIGHQVYSEDKKEWQTVHVYSPSRSPEETGKWQSKKEVHKDRGLRRASTSGIIKRSNEEGSNEEGSNEEDVLKRTWCHWSSCREWAESARSMLTHAEEALPLGASKVPCSACTRCLRCLLPGLAMLIGACLSVVSFDFVFDCLPLSHDTRLLIMAVITVYIPDYSASRLRDTLNCVLASCQEDNWRRSAKELDCESTKAVGLVQPSFWSDMVDLIQASVTLALLNLFSEWRDTIQGKNRIGKTSLNRLDKKVEQKLDADGLPTDEPRLELVSTGSRTEEPGAGKAGLNEVRKWHDEWSKNDVEEENPNTNPRAQQAARVRDVNLAASGTKLTMAQLFSAFGSIVAIVAGARDYSSACVSNAVLWENSTSITQGMSPLQLLLMKPEREPLVTWSSIFRATMSNLTLITVGVAIKNFITRTASAKAEVEQLVNPLAHGNDPQQKRKLSVSQELLEAIRSALLVFLEVVKALYGSVRGCCAKGVSWARRCCANGVSRTRHAASPTRPPEQMDRPGAEYRRVDVNEVAGRIENLTDEAAKMNARTILKIYKISSFAIFFIAFWYSTVATISLVSSAVILVPAVIVGNVVFFTVVPFLEFVATVLKRGLDEDDERMIDASITVVKGMIMLRSTLIMSQGVMIRSIFGWSTAEELVFKSYWSNGDALEKLAVIFTFNLDNMFDLFFNITSKLLSFVVLGIEVVALIGTNIKQTSMIRLCPRRCCRGWCNCQKCVTSLAKLAAKAGALNEHVKKIDPDELDAILQDGVDLSELNLEDVKAGVMKLASEYGRPALIAQVKRKVEPHIKKKGLQWDD
eukprot:3559759-Prymnesium_polylepis.1